AAHALLDAPAVRRGLADQLTQELDRRVPGAVHDPRTAAAVAAAVRDPRVTSAFADTIAAIHQALMTSDASTRTAAPFTIDGRSVSAAVHDALAPKDPKLAAEVARVPPLVVKIKAADLPHLHDPRSTADVVTVLAVAAALLLVTASLLMHHDRRTISRVGRRTAFLAVTPLVVFVAFPRVLAHASGDAPQIAAALLRVYGNRVLPSAIALVGAGLVIVVGAIVWPRRLAVSSHAPGHAAPRYTGPESPNRAPGEPPPTITEKMYL
ncbi:MAG TPA: hypothetical protein VGP92_11565, partial [Acidimicrobiia bacterium]|nr:hypothetical protein [Acidimicrobiia bacterium]